MEVLASDPVLTKMSESCVFN